MVWPSWEDRSEGDIPFDQDRRAVLSGDCQRGGGGSSPSPQGPWANVALVYFRRCYWKHKTKCLQDTIKNRRNTGDLIIQREFICFNRGEGRGRAWWGIVLLSRLRCWLTWSLLSSWLGASIPVLHLGIALHQEEEKQSHGNQWGRAVRRKEPGGIAGPAPRCWQKDHVRPSPWLLENWHFLTGREDGKVKEERREVGCVGSHSSRVGTESANQYKSSLEEMLLTGFPLHQETHPQRLPSNQDLTVCLWILFSQKSKITKRSISKKC